MFFRILFLFAVVAWPQDKSVEAYSRRKPAETKYETIQETPILSVDVSRPQIQFTVVRTDTLRPVSGLGAESFEVYIDGVRRKVVNVVQEQVPIAATILLDTSGSMRPPPKKKENIYTKARRKVLTTIPILKSDDGPEDERDRLTPAQEAIRRFLKEAHPRDQFSFITFSSQPKVISSFGASHEYVDEKLADVKARGDTALHDAIITAVRNTKAYLRTNSLPERRVLLVLSDGENNFSWHHESTVVNAIDEADMSVYAVGIVTDAKLLEKLANISGGTVMKVKELDKIASAVYELSTEMHNVYVLTTSEDNLDGKFRRVHVKLKNPRRKEADGSSYEMRVAWHQHGYYADRVSRTSK